MTRRCTSSSQHTRRLRAMAQRRTGSLLSTCLLSLVFLSACGDSGTDPGQGTPTLSVEGVPLTVEAGDSVAVFGVERRPDGSEGDRGGSLTVISGNLTVRGDRYIVGEMPGQGRVRVTLNGRQAEADVTVTPSLPPEITGVLVGEAGSLLEIEARIRGKAEPVTLAIVSQDPDITETSVVETTGQPTASIHLMAPGSAVLRATYRGSPETTFEIRSELGGPAAFAVRVLGAERLEPGGEFEIIGHRLNEIPGGFRYDAGPLAATEAGSSLMRFRLEAHDTGLGCELDPDRGRVTWGENASTLVVPRGGLPGDLRGLGPAGTGELDHADGCLYLSGGAYALAFTDRGTWEDIERMNVPFGLNREKWVGDDRPPRTPISFALTRHFASGNVSGGPAPRGGLLMNRAAASFQAYVNVDGKEEPGRHDHGHENDPEHAFAESTAIYGNLGARATRSWEYFRQIGAAYEEGVQYTVFTDGNQTDDEGPYWSSYPPHELNVGDRFRIRSTAEPVLPRRGEWAEVHHMSPSGRIAVIITLAELEAFTESELQDFRNWTDELEEADEQFRRFFPLERIGHTHPNDIWRASSPNKNHIVTRIRLQGFRGYVRGSLGNAGERNYVIHYNRNQSRSIHREIFFHEMGHVWDLAWRITPEVFVNTDMYYLEAAADLSSGLVLWMRDNGGALDRSPLRTPMGGRARTLANRGDLWRGYTDGAEFLLSVANRLHVLHGRDLDEAIRETLWLHQRTASGLPLTSFTGTLPRFHSMLSEFRKIEPDLAFHDLVLDWVLQRAGSDLVDDPLYRSPLVERLWESQGRIGWRLKDVGTLDGGVGITSNEIAEGDADFFWIRVGAGQEVRYRMTGSVPMRGRVLGLDGVP